MEELREQITPEIRELVDREMLVETRLLRWMKQTKKEKRRDRDRGNSHRRDN